MATTRVTLTVDSDAKKDGAELYKKIGLDLSTAFNILLKTSVRESRFPIALEVKPEHTSGDLSVEEMNAALRSAVNSRADLSEREYIVSMDIDEGAPYRLYSDGRKEYIND